jgi:SAM-dependent methyltransferase
MTGGHGPRANLYHWHATGNLKRSGIRNPCQEIQEIRNVVQGTMRMQPFTPLSRPWPEWRCPDGCSDVRDGGDYLMCERGHRFPVVGGIPRFVEGGTYADAFGEQWKRFRQTQLDSHTRTTVSGDRLRRCLGDRLWEDLEGKQVLECGCGAGRFTEVLLERGALVTSVDLSSAVEANRDNFPPGMRHRIAQADIMRLPFRPQQYDIVLCLGVVQHTPSPEQTVAALYSHVRPGGHLVFDHYGRSLGWYLSVKPLVRQVMRRLQPGRGMAVASALVDAFLPLHRRARHSRVGQIVLGRISPVMQYYSAFPEWPDAMQYEWAVLDTHDAMTDWFKHRRSVAEVHEALSELGLENIRCTPGGIGVEARGQRRSVEGAAAT